MTSEEYIIKKLEELEKENEELKKQIIKQEEPQEFEVIGGGGKYYYTDVCSYYNFNNYLKENNLTPNYLKECLEDESKLCNLMNLKIKSYGTYDKLCTLNSYDYDVKFIGYESGCLQNSTFIIRYKNSQNLYKLDCDNHWSSRELAEEELKKELKNEIGDYFKNNYQDKFESEKQ